ncbi:MAG: hypothetical protein U0Z70_15190 [Thermomicrobiales bacterium]
MSEARHTDAGSTFRPRAGEGPEPLGATRADPAPEHERNGRANDHAAGSMDLGEIGQEAVSQAQEQAVKIVSQARKQVAASVASQTSRGARIATVLGSSLHDAGSQLREQDEAAVATYLDQAADQVEDVGAMLENQQYGELIGAVQGLARRQPVLFFAAAVAIGVVAARFLRSSTAPGSPRYQRGPDAYAGRSKLQGDGHRVGGYA